jgi:hypothetical protein
MNTNTIDSTTTNPPDTRELIAHLADLTPDELATVNERAAAKRALTAPVEQVESEAVAQAHAPIAAALFGDAPSVWDDDLGDARRPIPGGCDLLLEGVPSYFFGARGSGKSTVVDTLGWNIAMHEIGVLVLDRENGPALSRARLDDAVKFNPALDEATLREFYDARHWPEFDKAWDPDDYADLIASRGFKVVVYDSVRELLGQLRLSSNSDDDWSELYGLLATPLIQRGITPVFLDNIGNVATERPRGTAAKLDAAPQGYRVWTRQEFTPDITGVVGIDCARSRLGDIGREWRMTVGGGAWELPTESTESRTTTTWDLILAALSDGEEHSQGDVADTAGVTTKTVRRLVNVEHTAARKEERDPVVIRTEQAGHPTTLRLRASGGEGLTF